MIFPENYNRATRMLYHACEFSEAANLLFEKDHQQKFDIYPRYYNPAIVCLSLSCEVYIKTLLMYYNVSLPKIHTLDKLFNKLPKDLKEKIKIVSDIDEIFIERFSRTFVTRRYFYENNESITYLNIGNLKILRDVLREESCNTVHAMSWNDYREKMGW